MNHAGIYFAKQTLPHLGDDGDEIGAVGGVVVAFYADGMAVVGWVRGKT